MENDEWAALEGAQEFARLAGELSRQGPEGPTLDRIVQLAVETIESADSCSITSRDASGLITTPASTDPEIAQLEDAQNALSDGPGLDEVWTLDISCVDNMTIENRWPRWAPEAVRAGIGSMLSVRLDFVRPHASLNLYAEKPHVFDATDLALASIYARHAGTALNAARTQDQLSAAIRSRQIIGVAQGMLMQRYGISLDGAFELLRRYSQNHNVKLTTIAANLVRAGGIPASGDAPLDDALIGRSD